ncbi:MAG: DUF3500 domain-containing protein [Chloroflexi bacterium]|nr:DUF3500 domain-containing protein [Chloroflexota bacterium]
MTGKVMDPHHRLEHQSGSELRSPLCYRVQSDDLLIEYDCTQNDANHTHSVLRNPRGDFGTDPLALHYAESHHHP